MVVTIVLPVNGDGSAGPKLFERSVFGLTAVEAEITTYQVVQYVPDPDNDQHSIWWIPQTGKISGGVKIKLTYPEE